MLTLIAMTEDAKRYSGPVTFFAANLADQLGFSLSSMERARSQGGRCGWLHYQPGAKRQGARYWVTIPPEEAAKNDGPSDEESVEMLSSD